MHLAYQCSFLFVCFIGLYAEHPYMVGVHPFELFFFTGYLLLVLCHFMQCIKMLVFVGIGVIILGGVFFLCVLGNCGRKFIKFVYIIILCVSL